MISGEISYDLVMGDDMAFVEGTFRISGGEWQVFIFQTKTGKAQQPQHRQTR